MAGKSAEHKEPTDVEDKCKLCGKACWLGPSQMELMELVGPESFVIVGDCCLPQVVQAADEVEIKVSDEIVERVKRSVGEGHSEGDEGDLRGRDDGVRS